MHTYLLTFLLALVCTGPEEPVFSIYPVDRWQVEQGVYNTDSAWLSAGAPDLFPDMIPDFTSQTVIIFTEGGDCHMQVFTHPELAGDSLVVKVYNVYGGCRAGGWETLMMLVNWTGPSEKITFERILLDSLEEYKALYPDR